MNSEDEGLRIQPEQPPEGELSADTIELASTMGSVGSMESRGSMESLGSVEPDTVEPKPLEMSAGSDVQHRLHSDDQTALQFIKSVIAESFSQWSVILIVIEVR